MTNFVLQTCKRGIPFVFLLAQTLIIIVLEQIDITYPAYLLLAAFAIIAYLWTAYSDPGFIVYESKELSPHPISISQPIIPLHHMSPKDYDRIISDQLPIQQRGHINELGLESFIEGNQQSDQCSPTSLQEVEKLKKIGENKTDAAVQPSKLIESTNIKQNKQCPSLSIVKEHSKLEENNKFQDRIKESVVFQYKLDKILVDQKAELSIIPEKLRNANRWCKICKNFQPLRARHCLQCHRCVANFDHHCPWMNNCIGEKNRLKLLLFILLEDIQLLYLTVKLQTAISINPNQNSLILLWLIIIFLAIVVSIMLVFQIFLILKNITTWEHIRWSKIEYLKIFDQGKLRSLFDRGVKANLSVAFRAACTKENINWMNFISTQAHNYQIKEVGYTDRRLIK